MAYREQDKSFQWIVLWILIGCLALIIFINFNMVLFNEPKIEIREIEKIKIKEILVHDCEIKPKTLTIYNGNQKIETSYKE